MNIFKGSEKGIAIVFALGVVALLLVIAIGFVSSTIIEKKTEENFRSLAVARMAAESGLNRVIAGMQTYSLDPTMNFSKVVSHEGDGSETYDEDLPTLMANIEGSDGREIFSWDTHYPGGSYDPADSDHITWQYLPTDHDADTPIIGRFAYIVTDSLDTPQILRIFGKKIDPSASVDSGVNADILGVSYAVSEGNRTWVTPWDTYSGRDGIEKTSLKPDANQFVELEKFVPGRPGRNINELFLRCIDSNTNDWFLHDYTVGISSYNANPRGQLAVAPPRPHWDTFNQLFNSLNITDDAVKDSFKEVFSLDYIAIPEAFWIDTAYNVRTGEGLFHRFNLTRTDWADVDTNSIKLDPKPYDETYDENLTTSIPWLKNWQSTGGMADSTACKNQIIANLIDYCDVDNIATTDQVDIENTSARDFVATYVGNDKCPYINEVKLIFRVRLDRRNRISGRRRWQWRYWLRRVYVELVGMYEGFVTDPSQNKRAEIYLDYEYQHNIDYRYHDGSWSTIIPSGLQSTFSNQLTMNLDFTQNGTDGYNDKQIIEYVYDYYQPSNAEVRTAWIDRANEVNPDSGFGSWYISPTELSIYAHVKELKIKLYNLVDDNLYDFSLIDDDRHGSQAILENYPIPSNDQNWYMASDYEVNDPRQNLSPGDWKLRTPPLRTTNQSTAQGLADGSTIMAKNDNCDLPILDDVAHADSDPEPSASEPWNVSTAYIRNAPMLSPWELGFIHRGDTWQTINLKKYNSTEGMNGGGNAYSDGDANILDQIKMTSDTETYGKINVNSSIEDVLIVLFEKIRVGRDLNTDPAPGAIAGTSEVTSSIAQSLSNLITTATTDIDGDTDSSKYFFTRAQVLRNINGIPELHNDTLGLTQTTDARQEEIIGKFINLTTALTQLPDQFSIIVVAQSIKDNGGGITIRKRVDGTDRTVSNVQTGTYDQYADEILSTQIIHATVRRNPDTDEFYVIDYDFLD